MTEEEFYAAFYLGIGGTMHQKEWEERSRPIINTAVDKSLHAVWRRSLAGLKGKPQVCGSITFDGNAHIGPREFPVYLEVVDGAKEPREAILWIGSPVWGIRVQNPTITEFAKRLFGPETFADPH